MPIAKNSIFPRNGCVTEPKSFFSTVGEPGYLGDGGRAYFVPTIMDKFQPIIVSNCQHGTDVRGVVPRSTAK
jgi:hypothetical protein